MAEERTRGRIAGAITRQQEAIDFARKMLPFFIAARADGAESLREIANWLNSRNHKTTRRKTWRSQSVQAVLDVSEKVESQSKALHKLAVAELMKRQRRLLPDDHSQRALILEEIAELKRKQALEIRAGVDLGRQLGGLHPLPPPRENLSGHGSADQPTLFDLR